MTDHLCIEQEAWVTAGVIEMMMGIEHCRNRIIGH
jgi:hypothetical protein